MTTTAVYGEVVAVGSIERGDEVYVSDRIGFKVVSTIDEYDEGVVVTYFDDHLWAYENRARAHGVRRIQQLCEKSLRLLQPDDVLIVRRGSTDEADRLRRHHDNEFRRRMRYSRFGA